MARNTEQFESVYKGFAIRKQTTHKNPGMKLRKNADGTYSIIGDKMEIDRLLTYAICEALDTTLHYMNIGATVSAKQEQDRVEEYKEVRAELLNS